MTDKALPQPVVESIAGFVAGVASTLVAHPLDLVKTRLQGTKLSTGVHLPRKDLLMKHS